MEKQETTKKLIAMGGNEWQKGNYHRVYFDRSVVAKLGGLDWDTYNTGNVSGATLNGKTLSNNKTSKTLSYLASCKFYYDVNESKSFLQNSGWSHPDEADTVIDKFFDVIKETIK